jgi:plasmid stabilization system protein ParE
MVIWAETAINHITQFIDDAKSGTEQTAKKYIEKLIDYVEILNEMPNIGKTFTSKVYKYELRQLLYKKHRIIYYLNNDRVVILAVIHTRLDVKKAIDRIKTK